jgi:hypothetical protein
MLFLAARCICQWNSLSLLMTAGDSKLEESRKRSGLVPV